MTSLRLRLTCLLLVQICSVFGQETLKSSLTFVIDETGSMYNEITEVRDKIDAIFESAVMTEDSQIDDIVLVTFADPDAKLRVATRDLNELKNALEQIRVHGGADCPEYSMTGIKLALENSLPYSSVYVFTDAASKDYYKFDEVLSIAKEKRIRIFFVLTGHCGSVNDYNYEVYFRLAEATNGYAYKVSKRNIKDIVPIVIQNIRSRRHILPVVSVPQMYNKQFDFSVYDKPVSVFIIIRGREPSVRIVDPEGRNVDIEYVMHMGEVLGVKVEASKPGKYVGMVTSKSEIHLQVLGSTALNIFDKISS